MALCRWEKPAVSLGARANPPVFTAPGGGGRRSLAAECLGCNKVAFGHHADDVAQTTLLNLFYQGRLETMRPRVEFFEGKLTVIRPLAYVPEKELVRFAAASNFPSAPAPCVSTEPSRRKSYASWRRPTPK